MCMIRPKLPVCRPREMHPRVVAQDAAVTMGTAGIGRRLKLFDKKTAQALLTALVFALALIFLYVAWRAIITFLFAIFFAYILEAPVSKLQVWLKGSRPAAIAVVYLVFAGLLIVIFSLLGPPVMDEAQKLMQQAPE